MIPLFSTSIILFSQNEPIPQDFSFALRERAQTILAAKTYRRFNIETFFNLSFGLCFLSTG